MFVLAAIACAAVAAGSVWAATSATINGTRRNDTLRGTARADRILGRAGNDRLYGRAGDDVLVGGAGNDLLVGGAGADRLSCGPGRDTALADAYDKVDGDCEKILGFGEPATPPPPAACANGKDDDGDGKTDFPSDPGCDGASDTDETDPVPVLRAKAGIYCGFSDQGPDLCLTTSPDATVLATIRTAAIVDCQDGSRWRWSIIVSGESVLFQPDLTFSYTYSGPISSSDPAFANIVESQFVKGTFGQDGTASGTLAISSLSFDYQGTHYSCTQNPVGWHATWQGQG